MIVSTTKSVDKASIWLPSSKYYCFGKKFIILTPLVGEGTIYSNGFFTIQRICLQFGEFELYWGAVFLLKSVHTFHDF